MDAMVGRDSALESKSFEILARRLCSLYLRQQGYGWDVGNTLEPVDPLDIVPRHIVKAAMRESALRKKVAPSLSDVGKSDKWTGKSTAKSSSNAPKKPAPKKSSHKSPHEPKRAKPSPSSSGGAGTKD